MTSNKSILGNYVQYQVPKSNYLGDSTVILAHGEGKVKLPTVNSTREIVLDLHQVLLVPKLTKNLLSGYLEMDLCTIQWYVESAFLNRGYLTNYFKVSRGIWQGCPLSHLLLVLGVEVTAQKRRPKLVSSKMIPLSSGGI